MIPTWMLYKVGSGRGGYHLPKRPSLPAPPVRLLSRFGGHKKHTNDDTNYGGTGDVHRFWSIKHGVYNGTAWFTATCRACTQTVNTVARMREHQKERGCPKRLIEAYKLLCRVPMRCVVCEASTTQTRWGMPLCSDKCVLNWRDEVITPTGLEDALQVVWLTAKQVN